MRTPSLTLRITSRRQAQQLIAAVRTPSLTLRVTSLNRKVRRGPGHVYSLWVAQRTSARMFGSRSAAFRSQLPMLTGMIAFSVFSLWLLKQPMEMRTSAM